MTVEEVKAEVERIRGMAADDVFGILPPKPSRPETLSFTGGAHE